MNNNYNIIQIQRYLQGELSREEMYEMERQALEDPFLNDAIEGYRLQKEINHGKLSLLQQRLAQRIEGQSQEREHFFTSGQRLSVAATACVLFVLGIVLFWMRANMTADQGAGSGLTETEVDLSALQSGSGAGLMAESVRIQANPTLQAESDTILIPVGGWDAFDQYLNDHVAEIIGEGSSTGTRLMMIEVVFEVDTQGQAQQIQLLEAEQGILNDDQKAVLIQVLEDGPLWEGKSQAMQLTLFVK